MEFFVHCIRYFILFVILLLVVLLVFSDLHWLILIGVVFVLLFGIVLALYHDDKKKHRKSQQKDKTLRSISGDSADIRDESTVRRIDTRLVGVTKCNKSGENIQNILPTLKAGEALAFVREYDNPHDINAVAVYCGSSGIGYINRQLAEDIACEIDAGTRVTGRITAITGGGNVSYGCNVNIIIHE